MNRTKFFFGFIAMVVMMTMTAFSSAAGLSKDVATVCDAFDKTAVAVSRATTEQELVNATHSFEAKDDDIDMQTVLSPADKAALKRSYVNFCKSLAFKAVELSKKDVARNDIDEALKVLEQKVDQALEESVTLGEFLKNAKRF